MIPIRGHLFSGLFLMESALSLEKGYKLEQSYFRSQCNGSYIKKRLPHVSNIVRGMSLGCHIIIMHTFACWGRGGITGRGTLILENSTYFPHE